MKIYSLAYVMVKKNPLYKVWFFFIIQWWLLLMLTRLALDSVVFYFYWSKDRITRVKLESAVHKDNALTSILILSSSENVFNSLTRTLSRSVELNISKGISIEIFELMLGCCLNETGEEIFCFLFNHMLFTQWT